MALQLLPGTPVLRRDREHLQVGVDPVHSAVVRDDPDVRRVLDALRAGRPPAPLSAPGREAVHRLEHAGLLREPAARPAATARVVVDASPEVATRVAAVLGSLGVLAAPSHDDPAVVLLVRDGVVPRPLLDVLMRADRPHLLVSTSPAAVTLGPFVEPGRTACVRCVDAHRTDTDPRWPVVVEQAAATPPVPRHPLLHPLALTWAAGDIQAWLCGRRPSTWSATVRLDDGLRHERTDWARHPACGCAWDAALAS